MKKNILLGSTILISGIITGCTKSEDIINTDEISEVITSNEDDTSSNLQKAKDEYIEGEKPVYINNILVANKDFGIPKNFASGLNDELLEAFNQMKSDAKEEGIILNIRSGFRSYETQETLYNNYIARDGLEKASRYSAKPGYSEHQTGLAIDITTEDTTTSIGDWFNDTKQAEWLYNNAYKYGFILRYPKGKEHITGYKYESWHYRYVGIEHSKNFAMNDLTLEEYLKIVNKDTIY